MICWLMAPVDVIYCISNTTDETRCGNNLKSEGHQKWASRTEFSFSYSNIVAIYKATTSLKVHLETPNLNIGPWPAK